MPITKRGHQIKPTKREKSTFLIVYISFFYCDLLFDFRLGNPVENVMAHITISNESLNKNGESIIVSGKGMSSTIKVIYQN